MTFANLRFVARQRIGHLSRLVRPLPRPAGSAVRLHLGCGEIDWPGFINVDGIDRPHVHHVTRVDRLRQFADASVDFVYCSHVLEHLGHRDSRRVLAEWCRVLKPGGRLCVSVPDFDAIVAMYEHSGRCVADIVQPLFGAQDYPLNFHYTVFNEISLRDLMLAAGFSSAARWQPGQDEWHSLPDWSGRSIELNGRSFAISLNLEATK